MNYKPKQEILDHLKHQTDSLKKLKKSLSEVKGAFTSKKEIQNVARDISTKWFEDIKSNLINLGINSSDLDKYNYEFDRLLRLSAGNSRITSYQECIDNLISILNKELIINVTKLEVKINELYQLDKITENVDPTEIEYLKEAIECAHNKHYRASIVLGWSAAVWRFYKTIEKLGFDEFNKKSLEMKNKTTGRYKRFSKAFTISSFAELQTVFDTDLLWVLEYWGLIDSNEHDRLEICFTMRNNAAHPGEAPISPENLLSFYSDLKNMVFDNPKFPPS